MFEDRPERVKLTLHVQPGSADAWRELAKHLGYVADRGVWTGEGSISGLFDAIASGALVVRPSQLSLFERVDADRKEPGA